MQKSDPKKQFDDDDLPPELEDLPEELVKKQSSAKSGSGNVNYGDITEVKEEKVLPTIVDIEKKDFDGIVSSKFENL